MEAICGYRARLPTGSDGITMLEKFKYHHCHIRTDASGIVWVMTGVIWNWVYHAKRGHVAYLHIFHRAWNAEPTFISLCQKWNLPISPLGLFAMIDPSCAIPPSHFTFCSSGKEERLAKNTPVEIGAISDLNLNEIKEQRQHRNLGVVCAGRLTCQFPVQYTRTYPYPKRGEIINLTENVTIDPAETSQLIMIFHPPALVNFSVLQVDRSNPVSYWNYLPQDLLTHYIYPMVEHMEVAREEKNE